MNPRPHSPDTWQIKSITYAGIAKGFYQALITEKQLPKFSWQRLENGDLRIETKTRGLEVKLWKAHNPQARDFRLDFTKRTWEAKELKGEGSVYTVALPAEQEGWTAYFAELQFDGGLTFTTEVFIIRK
jgi:PhoPQ-activated pathogenicity-related protein